MSKRIDTAIAICQELDGQDSYRSTSFLLARLAISSKLRPSVLPILHGLKDAGVLESIGKGKYRWRLKRTDWNRANPFIVDGKEYGTQHEDTSEKDAEIERLRQEVARMQLEAKLAKDKEKQDGGVHTIVIKYPDGTKETMEDLVHEKFTHVMDLALCRMNVLLYGPTGCGKSYLAKQVADALKLPYYFVSCTAGMSEGVLVGRLLPVGKNGQFTYVTGEFVKAYEEGGVFLFDEIDAADANTLLIINAALANGHLAVGNRPEKPYAVKHPDFVCIAAANTVGTGTTRMYSGRNQLDAATLDRFLIGKTFVDYDTRVEEALCPSATLRQRLWRYRKAINAHKLERAMSTRFMRDAYVMMHEYQWTLEKVDEVYFAGWREDEINKVKSYMG